MNASSARKIAVIGSRSLAGTDLSRYLPQKGGWCLVSGGAIGVDTIAERWADAHGIPKIILLPDYPRYGHAAPLVRDREIVDRADCVLAFWDGVSHGTDYTVRYALSRHKPVELFVLQNGVVRRYRSK
jgi:hypothetical protein